MIAVSIVSHGHGAMVSPLVECLLALPEVSHILLTCNIPETLELPADSRLQRIDNAQPKGFGANHNAAFAQSKAAWFCPLNPDVSLLENPFPVLLTAAKHNQAAIVAPLVQAPDGSLEDNARYFPTPWRLLRKLLLNDPGKYCLMPGAAAQAVDWVAGMFMLFERTAYQQLDGFDETYFLYYEDADICRRAWHRKIQVFIVPAIAIVHDARRDSHRKWVYLRWHIQSMLRFFLKG